MSARMKCRNFNENEDDDDDKNEDLKQILIDCKKVNPKVKKANDEFKELPIEKKIEAYRNNSMLYREMKYHFLSWPIFRLKNLSYMDHLHTNNGLKEKNKITTESDPTMKDNLIIKTVKLDSIEGFKYAFIDYFVIRRIAIQKLNESSQVDVDQKAFVGTSEIEFDGKEALFKHNCEICISSEFLPNCNQEFNYSLGMLIRYNKREKSKENGIDEKSTLLNVRTESSTNIAINDVSSDLLKMFSCVCELDKDFYGEQTQKLVSVSNHRKFNLNSTYKWVEIEEDDIFIKANIIDFKIMYNENMYLTDAYLKNVLKEDNKFCSILIYQSQNAPTVADIVSHKALTELPLVKYNEDEFDKEPTVKVLYSFNCTQKDTVMTNYRCLFCNIDCHAFKTLTIHLKVYHERFFFKFLNQDPYKIVVSLNNQFDPSTDSNPLKNCYLSYASKNTGPVKRKAMTSVIVSNEKRNYLSNLNDKLGIQFDQTDLSNFIRENDNKRVYYHSQTCGPILPSELDINSEDEEYPDWIKQKTISMIDDFTDVNVGEKEIAKMWNWHVMKYSKNIVGDVQIPQACELFIEEHGEEIINKNLKFNLILHLCNFHSLGLVTSSIIEKLSIKLDGIQSKKNCTVK